MESNVPGAQGPLTAGDICNCSRVIRHILHGCFPNSEVGRRDMPPRGEGVPLAIR